VLSHHAAIQHAAVVVQETAEGDRTLIGFLIAPTKPEAAELRDYLREHLPDYMVPSKFVLVNTLPLNANGKIDRRALVEKNVVETPETSSAPELNATQQQLIEIWREVLHVNAIKLEDNFFELGGHSLLAVQIIARVRNAFGVPVALRCIFEAPTVAGLAEVVAQYSSQSREEEDVARILREVEGLSEEEAQRLLEAEK